MAATLSTSSPVLTTSSPRVNLDHVIDELFKANDSPIRQTSSTEEDSDTTSTSGYTDTEDSKSTSSESDHTEVFNDEAEKSFILEHDMNFKLATIEEEKFEEDENFGLKRGTSFKLAPIEEEDKFNFEMNEEDKKDASKEDKQAVEEASAVMQRLLIDDERKNVNDSNREKFRTSRFGLVDLDAMSPCTKEDPCLLDKLIYEDLIRSRRVNQQLFLELLEDIFGGTNHVRLQLQKAGF